MGNEPTPTPTPPSQPQPQTDPQEETRFRAWFQRYLTEHEPTNNPGSQPVHPSQGSQSQGGQSTLESAIEAVMNRRAQKDQAEQRIKTLETDNTTLKSQLKDLTDKVTKRGRSNIFSIFDGL